MTRFERLRQAVINKSPKMVSLYLRAGAISNEDEERILLNLASAIGDLPVFDQLVKSSLTNWDSETVAWSVSAEAEGGAASPEILRFLLERVKLSKADLSTTLGYAAAGGDLECVRILLSIGADANHVNPISKTTPAENAIRNFNNEILEELIRAGCQIERGVVFEDISETDEEQVVEMSLQNFARHVGNSEACELISAD